MKKLLLVGCLMGIAVTTSFAQEETDDSPNVWGAGVYIKTSPYKDHDASVWPIPVVVWRNERFFIDGQRGGLIAFENDNWRGNIILAPRFMGYDADDASSLNGMENRDASLDAGGQLVWTLPHLEKTTLSFNVISDVLAKHGGQEVELTLKKKIPFKICQLVPAVGVKWQSKDLVDYYYGVRVPEITSTRAAYTADSTVNYYVNLGFNMGLSKDLILVTLVGVEFLGDEITDSPIVDQDEIVSGLVGIVKRF